MLSCYIGTEEERLTALDKVAEACFLQGNYHLATKKWTQVTYIDRYKLASPVLRGIVNILAQMWFI